MSGPLPARIDPHRAVAAGEQYCGDLPLSALPRLADMIEPDQQPGRGQAVYQMRFGKEASGRPVVQGSVQTQLRLRCQRCGEPFDLPVAVGFTLALVTGLDEAAALPDEYDPLLVPAARAGDMIAPRDLIEDELILAIPVVPRHPESECPALNGRGQPVSGQVMALDGSLSLSSLDAGERGGEDTAAEGQAATADGNVRPNPFAILAQLRRGG